MTHWNGRTFGNENSEKSVLTKLAENILPGFTPFGVSEG
jgi:hypothetical protein